MAHSCIFHALSVELNSSGVFKIDISKAALKITVEE